MSCTLPDPSDLEEMRKYAGPVTRNPRSQVSIPGFQSSAIHELSVMLNADLETSQNRIVDQLRKGLDPDAIYLFGSHSRGDAGADSDLDFLVIVRESDQPRSKRAQAAREVVTDRSVAKDILVMTQEEWKRGLKVVASLPTTVVREGKLLYER